MSTRWERIERLFEGALDQPSGSRAAWLAAQCAADSATRDEVLRLLDAHGRTGGILDRGAPALVYDITDHLQRALKERYRIEGELGHGGSAIVLRAHELKHDRAVVLKVLKPEVAKILGTQRFLREVQIAARLAHPHILGLIDSGQAEDLLFYVMPYVAGETLRTRLRSGPLPLGESVTILRDVADALAYAHRAGVVHRDLKPENVLCVAGHAFVMDFGIAKVLEGTEGFQTVHNSGMWIGTPAYMAPEQAAGDPATDQRADIYAWGLLGQELFTGRTPPQPDVRATQPTFKAAASSLRLEVPPVLIELIDACLTTDPRHRVRSMDKVRDALDHLATPQPRMLPLPRRWARARWGVGAAAAVALGALGTAIALKRTPDLPLPVAVAALTNETGDSTLSAWGRLAGDWMTQGLQETGRVSVVPWAAAAQASDLIKGGGDVVRRMRDETGAGTVVTGAYYLIGDSVRFQAAVANAATGRLLGALPPVTAHRSEPERAVRELRARLMGQMAVWSDDRIAAIPGFAQRPPTFEAYQVFDQALERYNDQDYRGAADEFRRARQLDSAFVVAGIYEALCAWNTGQSARVAALLAELRERRSSLSEYYGFELKALEALMQGDRAAALAAQQRAAQLAPGSKVVYNSAHVALELNRPAEARAALESLDPDRGAMRGWSSYWTALAHANHLLGDHDREVTAARGMRTRFPDRRVAIVLEARALAAGGRVAELDSVLEATAMLPARTYWSQGAAMVSAGEEMLAHGDSNLARGYLERAHQWLADQRRSDPDYAAYREWAALALYGLRRWSEVVQVLEPLVHDSTPRYSLRALSLLAAFRANGGPPPEAPPSTPWEGGERPLQEARVAAVAGDYDRAIERLSEMLRLGLNGFPWVHGSVHHDLAPLAADPRYQRLMNRRP